MTVAQYSMDVISCARQASTCTRVCLRVFVRVPLLWSIYSPILNMCCGVACKTGCLPQVLLSGYILVAEDAQPWSEGMPAPGHVVSTRCVRCYRLNSIPWLKHQVSTRSKMVNWQRLLSSDSSALYAGREVSSKLSNMAVVCTLLTVVISCCDYKR